MDSSASDIVTSVSLNKAVNGEQVVVTANIQDTVTEDYVILEEGPLYYIENGSDEKIIINQTNGQYSFTMPANGITIGVEKYRRLDDFTFSENSVSDYTGSDSELILPSYYETVTIDSQDYTIEKDTGTMVTKVSMYGFFRCYNLTSITLPSSLMSIGGAAFTNCYSLAIVINNSPNFIISDMPDGDGYHLRYGILEVVNTAKGEQVQGRIETINNVIYYINDTTGEYIVIGAEANATDITIKKEATAINYYAFHGNNTLQSVTFEEGSSLTSIGSFAFQYCNSLTSITLPSTLIFIESSALSNCSNLQYNNYNNGKYLGNDKNPYLVLMAVDDTSVQSFEIHKDCKIISSYAFRSTGLTSITIPEGVTSIGSYVFSGCSSLTSITLPSTLTYIYGSVFGYCTSLTEIHYEGTLDQWLDIDFVSGWSSDSNNISLYINGDLVDDITINKDIPDYAFSRIGSLAKVTIGEDVTRIGSDAFSGCSNLTTVVIESDDIYKAADGTGYNQAGGLLEYATTVKVLKAIVDGAGNVNDYLNNESNFTKTTQGPDDLYYTYTITNNI